VTALAISPIEPPSTVKVVDRRGDGGRDLPDAADHPVSRRRPARVLFVGEVRCSRQRAELLEVPESRAAAPARARRACCASAGARPAPCRQFSSFCARSFDSLRRGLSSAASSFRPWVDFLESITPRARFACRPASFQGTRGGAVTMNNVSRVLEIRQTDRFHLRYARAIWSLVQRFSLSCLRPDRDLAAAEERPRRRRAPRRRPAPGRRLPLSLPRSTASPEEVLRPKYITRCPTPGCRRATAYVFARCLRTRTRFYAFSTPTRAFSRDRRALAAWRRRPHGELSELNCSRRRPSSSTSRLDSVPNEPPAFRVEEQLPPIVELPTRPRS